MVQLPDLLLIADACPPIFKEGFGSTVKGGFDLGMILRNAVLFIMSLILKNKCLVPGRVTNK